MLTDTPGISSRCGENHSISLHWDKIKHVNVLCPMAHPVNPWRDEKDWLVSLVSLTNKNDPAERRRAGEEIGYLFGFASYTDTRIMAEIGDDGEDFTVFQLLFSFKSDEQKKTFLGLVKANEITRLEDEGEYQQFTVPSRSEIDDAQSLGNVLPPDIAERATIRGTIVFGTLSQQTRAGSDIGRGPERVQ